MKIGLKNEITKTSGLIFFCNLCFLFFLTLQRAEMSSDVHDIFYKLVLVGDSGVGKSSLLSRYAYNEFQKESKTTIGVDFATKVLNINNKSIKVQIWDTAGQERYRAISRVFYANAAAAIVTYDVTNIQSFANIENWLAEIQNKCESGITIIIVANKIDLRHLTCVPLQQGEEYASSKNCLFIETSAKNSINVEKAFEEIIEQVYKKNIKERQTRKISRFINLEFGNVNEDGKETRKISCCSI